MNVDKKEINALITLLDDEDSEVVDIVSHKLMSYGKEVIPLLEEMWNPDLNEQQSAKLDELIHGIQFYSLIADIKSWRTNESHDLLKGYFLVSKYFYPELDFSDITKKIDKLVKKVWIELNYNQTPFEQVQIFNQVFFNHIGFKQDELKASPIRQCINNILESKIGELFSIGLLYLILSRKLNIPIFPVVNGNFFTLCACRTENLDFTLDNTEDVLFYINPFQKGMFFSKLQIADYLSKNSLDEDLSFYNPVDIPVVLERFVIFLGELSLKVQNPNMKDDLVKMAKKIR